MGYLLVGQYQHLLIEILTTWAKNTGDMVTNVHTHSPVGGKPPLALTAFDITLLATHLVNPESCLAGCPVPL